ncbi:MAG: orotidine-5'-phosphate decarboxylase [Bradymonadia bacterium]
MTDKRLCLALDVPDLKSAQSLIEQTAHVFGVYKIGLELFCAEGPNVVHALKRFGAPRVFLDLKLHDIPRTVAHAVSRLASVGADYLTIHTAGGRGMMEAAAAAAPSELRLLGVTILTSLDLQCFSDIGGRGPLSDVVLLRARHAQEAGLAGVVASAREVAQLRHQVGADLALVTPGIRFAGQSQGDQLRVATPATALADGASMLVIGRAVTAAERIEVALQRLQDAVGTT